MIVALINKQQFVKICGFLMLMSIILIMPAMSFAQDHKDDKGQTKSSLKKSWVTIKSKTPNSVIVKGIAYTVTNETIVLDDVGIQISLKKLPVPTSAMIYYEPASGKSPVIHKIVMGNASKNARKGWVQLPE